MDVWEKSTTVDPEVRAYVQSLVNAVGGQSTLDDRYAVGDDALAVLHDLLRWLRLYDDKLDRLDVKRCLAEANLVKGDLLEILALWPEEAQESKTKSKLALACLQLLVPLTWPIVLEDDKTTVNHHRHLPYLQLAQVLYKRSILHFEDAAILRTAIRIALQSMQQPRRERSRRDEGIIRLPLYLFRNLAMIVQPQQLPSQGDENEVGRSATIEAFERQDVFSFLLTVGSGAGEEFQEQDVIVLETLFHLLKGVDAKKLFMEKLERSEQETNELDILMRKERAMHKGYNRHAPTRHNRFGTMIWVKREGEKISTVTGQNSITNEATTLHQMDATKKWNKPKYRGKSADDTNEDADFTMKEVLSENASKHLRKFVEDFLDSSFNPVFSSLRKAIERENERILPTHHKQYFYLASWFLAAAVARNDKSGQLQRGGLTTAAHEDSTFAYIAAVLDQETFVLLNRHMQRAFDEKRWQDVHATLLCLTQILLTVQSMAESKHDEDQEIAENIQNRIFYEEATHDRMAQILRTYANQGFGYLDAITEAVHVFVRMLEQYSKQNVDLQIRSKRRTRRIKKKAQNADDSTEAQDGEDEDATEDERQAFLTVNERKFDFARFSAKFMTQSSVTTFITLLRFYQDLTAAQLKRCHRFLYRLAFKHELTAILFRVDILMLLHAMIKGPQCLSVEIDGYKDWEQLIQQVFRRCVKWIERETEGEGWKEAAVVEMLFSKIPSTYFYLQNGYERVVEKRPPRPPAELGFKASVENERKVPIIVSVMLEQGKQDPVDWLKRELSRAVEERESWEAQQRDMAILEEQPEQEGSEDNIGRPNAPEISLNPDTDERKAALFKDKHLRLLLESVGMQRLGAVEDVDASWIVPSEIIAAQLREAIRTIQETEFQPPTFEEGKTALDMLKNKSSSNRETAFSGTDSDGSEDDDINQSMFPPNLRLKRKPGDEEEQPKKRRRLTRRNQPELTEEEVQQRAAERKKKERERNAKIKSQLFITASDDESDPEADAEFFRLEAERRKKTAKDIRNKLIAESKRREDGLLAKGGQGRKTKKRDDDMEVDDHDSRTEDSDADSDLYNSSDDEWRRAFSESGRYSNDASDAESNSSAQALSNPIPTKEADTPTTSPTAAKVLGEVSANAAPRSRPNGKQNSLDEVEEESDAAEPPSKTVSSGPVRRMRAGFIIDDDSDDE